MKSAEQINSSPVEEGGIKNEFESVFPLRLKREVSGELVMQWNISDPDDLRPSYWETILKEKGDGKNLMAIGHYVAKDNDTCDVWKEISFTISPNRHRTTYQVTGHDQMNIPTRKIAELLQAISRGVELYTSYKESALAQQQETTYISDEFPVNYSEDDVWKKVTYMYGIRPNPQFEVLSD